MESTKEIMSLGASSDSVAIWYMGDMGLSVMAITSALREQANCTAWMAILEYRGKQMLSSTSPGPMCTSCS